MFWTGVVVGLLGGFVVLVLTAVYWPWGKLG